MNDSFQAQLYLADLRGRSAAVGSESAYTFNFGEYTAENREPFGVLHLFNQHKLQAGASLNLSVGQQSVVLLLPITGGLDYTIGQTTTPLEPGQVALLPMEAGSIGQISNPYPTETIHYLQIGLTLPSGTVAEVPHLTEFDLSRPNTLLPIFDDTDGLLYRGYIGRYEGRQEGSLVVAPLPSAEVGRVFVFVIQGAFEVANRLLHANDGLALTYTDAQTLEFEALSNEAILLIISHL